MNLRPSVWLPLLLVVPFAQAQNIQINKENKTIAITSTDSAEKEADLAIVSVGFNAYGKDQNGTYAEASRISNAIVDALLAAGVKRDQIQSEQQSLTEIGEGDKQHYAAGLRFFFLQSWKVATGASNASQVLHVAVVAGANNSGNIDWSLTDPNELEAAAAGKALVHAREIAERMADGLHAKLGPLLYASNQMPEQSFNALQKGRGNLALAAAKSVGISSRPIALAPDKVTRSATVYAVFAIE